MTDDFAPRITDLLVAAGQTTARELDLILGQHAGAGEIFRPQRLMDAMRHGALNGGKRLRPFLLIETARMFGNTTPGVMRAACALELIHCYSLIHDDLPAMDDDDLRRGQPSVHKAYDEATAILAGDSLLTLAFAVMADPIVHPDGAVRAELVRMLAAASGPGGMAGGQMLDLAAEASAAPLNEADIRQLQAMKTGALICFACEAGAVISGADSAQRKTLSAFGAQLGLLFQITDDILDTESDAATLGKAAGKDAGRNKATLVILLGLDAVKELRKKETDKAGQLLQAFGAEADVLRAALRFACERKY